MPYDTSDYDYASWWGNRDAYEEMAEFMKYMRREHPWVTKGDYEGALWAWLSHRTAAIEGRLAEAEISFYQHVQDQLGDEKTEPLERP
jgi:hypothetical protein